MTLWKILSNIDLPMSIWHAFLRNWTNFIAPNENRRALNSIAGQGTGPSRDGRLHNGIWLDSIFDLDDGTAPWNILIRYSAPIRNCPASLRRFWNLPNSSWRS